MQKSYYVTGNQTVSLPCIDRESAGLESLTFLSMQYRGMIEMHGGSLPLIQPCLWVDEQLTPFEDLHWWYTAAWIPCFQARAGHYIVQGVWLAPVDQRGFCMQLTVTAPKEIETVSVQLGVRGQWKGSRHCINESKPLQASLHAFSSNWNNTVLFEARSITPLFALAPMSTQAVQSKWEQSEQGIFYQLSEPGRPLSPLDSRTVTIYWGLGLEEVSAGASARELARHGYHWLWEQTTHWLQQRILPLKPPELNELYHRNLFFCLFYSIGITLDTEELVLVTSRSPRYYVSAAYWDRDSLLWAFPAVLEHDPTLARQMLSYAFGRQGRNIGVHSRFIDGTVLEPGFELDELVAPLIALDAYVHKTGDDAPLAWDCVQQAIPEILQRLQAARHPDIPLYSTFLQPTDDPHTHPYLTYCNALVCKALRGLASLSPSYAYLDGYADATESAIWQYCVQKHTDGPVFAWSVDLNGHYDIYDEPPGSLLLLPWLGFCSADSSVYRNTVKHILSPQYQYSFAGTPFGAIGCTHAPHPWLLSFANYLLSRQQTVQVLYQLAQMPMDNGIVCESVDEYSGKCTTGAAFATCAGFVCCALRYALSSAAHF